MEDGVAVLTLNRPERRNALTETMLAALAATLRAVEADADVGCVVLTGAGGAFCAGGDVKAMAGARDDRARPFDGASSASGSATARPPGACTAMPKPTIAAIPGAAAGAGLALALACDLRYASEDAVFTTAFARVGFAGDYGGTWFLTRLVGPAKARELYFFAERWRPGGAGPRDRQRRRAPGALEAEVLGRARRLATGPRIAFAYMKENLNRALTAPLEEALDLEASHHLHTGTTEDHREAARAFVEKREPRFAGR